MLQRCYLWYMETLFACLKTRGFRFEDTHLTDPDRVSKRLALLAIAFGCAHQTGEWLHQQRPIPLKKPLQRRVKSLFRHGFDPLRHIILNLSDPWKAFERTLHFVVLY